MADSSDVERATATVRALLRKRDGSICPSDVARVVDGEAWRDRMPLVRRVAGELAERGELRVTQKDAEVTVEASGPIRLRRGARFDEHLG